MGWPKIVGAYVIDALLGQGNYGEVRLAHHLKTKKKFAVKILPRRFLELTEYTADVRREMSILMALEHPNIICLNEVCVRNSQLFLIMELASNGDLFTYINEVGALPIWQARLFFCQLLKAVQYCHSRGVYHRDLKPENVLLTDCNRQVKLADFGFAAVVDKHSKVHPLLRTNCGSPHYCAPEVWNGEHKEGYDGSKADAFSCGVVLYCMLVGIQPFYDSLEDIVLEKVNKCHFEIPSTVPAQAGNLIKGLLTRDPSSRLSVTGALRHPWIADGGMCIPRILKEAASVDGSSITLPLLQH